MNENQRKQFQSLVEFLGKVLGPDYEIVLHDLSRKRSSLAAIANGRMNDRGVNAPTTGFLKKLFSEKLFKSNDYILNHQGRIKNDRIVPSSSFIIKDRSQNPVGLLCINFDDSRYQELSQRVLALRHAVGEDGAEQPLLNAEYVSYDPFYNDIETEFEGAFSAVQQKFSASLDRLTQKEKEEFMLELYKKDFFLIKGAVAYAANKLCCSPATAYRYLQSAKKMANAQKK